MTPGRPAILQTAKICPHDRETNPETSPLCQKQRHEACAVCHKHPQEAFAVCHKHPQACAVCHKHPQEAFAVCHKHPQAAEACQKRLVSANATDLSESFEMCASCRAKAYANACMSTARQGTRHNAWAWQLCSSVKRPRLLNCTFLYVRGVLNHILAQFLPRGAHVLTGLCTDLRAMVAEHTMSTPCVCVHLRQPR